MSRRGRLELSMRTLADELSVSPMALYAHVADKGEILDEILDDALARYAQPPAPSDDWRAWMLEFATQLHSVLLDRPQLLDRYSRQPVGVRMTLVRMEAALAVLTSAGFDEDEAVHVFATVHTVTLGFTSLELARRRATTAQQDRAASTAIDRTSPHYWPAFFSTLPADRYPHLTRARPDLTAFTAPQRFHEVIGSILAGAAPTHSKTEVEAS